MTTPTDPALTRRRLLSRLGLGLGVAYVAPVMLHLDQAAASSWPSRRSRASQPSRRSRSSAPSRRSHHSRGSHPSRPTGWQTQGRDSTGEMPLWLLRALGLA